MPTVFIPALLRNLTAGRDSAQVPGETVRQIIDNLDLQFPGIKARLMDGPNLKKGLTVAIGSQVAHRGLSEPVPENAEVHFVPAISGGTEAFVAVHNVAKASVQSRP